MRVCVGGGGGGGVAGFVGLDFRGGWGRRRIDGGGWGCWWGGGGGGVCVCTCLCAMNVTMVAARHA